MFCKTILSTMALLLFTTGCDLFNPIGPIIQIGMYWVEGEAHKYYNTDKDIMITSVKSVLNDLDFPIIEESQEGDYYWIKASDGSFVATKGDEPGVVSLQYESTFKIKIREVKVGITKLSIRVNTFGDRPYAEMVYRHVDKEPKVIQFVSQKELNTKFKTYSRP